jgi:hypothetical protein
MGGDAPEPERIPDAIDLSPDLAGDHRPSPASPPKRSKHARKGKINQFRHLKVRRPLKAGPGGPMFLRSYAICVLRQISSGSLKNEIDKSKPIYPTISTDRAVRKPISKPILQPKANRRTAHARTLSAGPPLASAPNIKITKRTQFVGGGPQIFG